MKQQQQLSPHRRHHRRRRHRRYRRRRRLAEQIQSFETFANWYFYLTGAPETQHL